VNVIIIITAPLTNVSEDQGEDLECLDKACQAAITEGGLFTDNVPLAIAIALITTME